MNTRDYMAGVALGAFLQGATGLGQVSKEERKELWDVACPMAYEISDAMIKASEVTVECE